MNYLLGKKDLLKAVKDLWNENPSVFDSKVLQILIAARSEEKKGVALDNGSFRLLEEYFVSPERIMEYFEGTGLAQVFRDKQIKNLVDYVFGVETGLDTNARKNRGGTLMARRIARMFDDNGIVYEQEVSSKKFDELKILGSDQKKFDFVVQTRAKTFLIEVNFYSGGGSKLNEVARSFTELGAKINPLRDFEFVWITDGKGWVSARNQFQVAFESIPSVYNLATLGNFIKEIKRLQ